MPAFALGFIAVVVFAWLLVIGQHILIPLVIAIFLWYLINGMARAYGRIVPFRWLQLMLSFLTLLGIVWLPVELMSNAIPKLLEAAPNYQKNLQQLLASALKALHLESMPQVSAMMDHIDIAGAISGLAGGITSLAGNVVLVLVYLAFLFAEQGTFDRKLTAMFPEKAQSVKVRGVMENVYHRIVEYIWLKTLTSLGTAVVSYAVLRLMGLDFPAFWAVLIFLLNYIPNIGSIIATAFPTVLAFIQYGNYTDPLMLLAMLGSVQFLVGNVIEPRVMGNTLNLSPLVILVALVFWGSLWGIVGMYLSVPLMVILTLILAEIPATRKFAILFTSNGKL